MDDLTAVAQLHEAHVRLRAELAKVIVGQEAVIDQLLIAFFARGHCLLVGVPGLAKTLLIRTLADSLALQFNRVQFTPDLMPSDITGTEMIQEDKATGQRSLRFVPGPIFANVVLADEINRTPPKTQAALLEAMQEGQVTVGGRRHSLPDPFFVLATQNPIEQEGTYPLPEAQLDRFMFHIQVDYPGEEEELQIIKRTTTDHMATAERTLDAAQVQALSQVVRRIPVPDHVARHALALARRTRPAETGSPDFIKHYVQWGAGPRAGQYLVLGAKARAVLQGRHHATIEDVRAIAYPVLRHRLRTNFNADAEGVTTNEIIRRLLASTPAEGDEERLGKLPPVLRPADTRPT
ncbi:MAG: MoxR family ATPase [Pirellulales bacterium]